MSEFRQNPVTGEWVLIAPSRSKRPDQYRQVAAVMRGEKTHDPACPFCYGNEATNPEICRLPANSERWDVRVIPNKFPSLGPEVHTEVAPADGFYRGAHGIGLHEVVVTGAHDEPVALQSTETIEQTLQVLQSRMKEHAKDDRLAYVQLFHNHGKDAGASIVHPHYQVMSTPFVPPHIHREVQGCEQYMEKNGSDVYGDIVKREVADGRRLVHDGERFAVISAYASRQPFETWVLPKKPSARFEEASAEDLTHLAAALKSTLSKLYTKLNDPPLNFYIHTLPLPGSGRNVYDERAYRWHLTIFPRISVWAGFEYGTGIPVNPVPPESSASFLKT